MLTECPEHFSRSRPNCTFETEFSHTHFEPLFLELTVENSARRIYCFWSPFFLESWSCYVVGLISSLHKPFQINQSGPFWFSMPGALVLGSQVHLHFRTVRLVDMASRLKHIAELSARVRCLCWGEAANLMDADLKEIPVDPRLSESWKLLLRSSAGVSPCFERLLAVLQEQKSSSQTSHGFRCIVFVETRTAAREMTRVLNFVSGSESAFRWLRPTCFAWTQQKRK